MTGSDISIKSLIEQAEKLGEEQKKLDQRNRKRRAKGREPLPDTQEQMDIEVQRRRHRTNDRTTVDAADAIRLYEMRKAEMERGADDDDDDVESHPVSRAVLPPLRHAVKEQSNAAPENFDPNASQDPQAEAAVRAAEQARRVQDLKNGRIDHAGNWSEAGQQLEGGDNTKLAEKPSFAENKEQNENSDANSEPERPKKENGSRKKTALPADFQSFVKDLYTRLGVSFEGLEHSLSDLQGRVAEIVTATTPQTHEEDASPANDEKHAFDAFLSQKTPVVFNVGGTEMTFDAICVQKSPPCLTVVSRIGSATITPKPGAQLSLSYDCDGIHYENDPVTYLGTRFELPTVGLSFVGFIRDLEAGQMDVDAGVTENEAPGAGE